MRLSGGGKRELLSSCARASCITFAMESSHLRMGRSLRSTLATPPAASIINAPNASNRVRSLSTSAAKALSFAINASLRGKGSSMSRLKADRVFPYNLSVTHLDASDGCINVEFDLIEMLAVVRGDWVVHPIFQQVRIQRFYRGKHLIDIGLHEMVIGIPVFIVVTRAQLRKYFVQRLAEHLLEVQKCQFIVFWPTGKFVFKPSNMFWGAPFRDAEIVQPLTS
jgi:hypothetical protein